jgi:hypothetical protein
MATALWKTLLLLGIQLRLQPRQLPGCRRAITEITAQDSHTATATSVEREEEIAKEKTRDRLHHKIPAGGSFSGTTMPRGIQSSTMKIKTNAEALVEYKKEHNSTMVPQCYGQEQRWVHSPASRVLDLPD